MRLTTMTALHARLDESHPQSALSPVARFEIIGAGSRACGRIVLQGAITAGSAGALRGFLQKITVSPVARWTIDMRGLVLLSASGLCHLARFANARRQQGAALQVVGIHENVYATLLDLDLLGIFAADGLRPGHSQRR